MGLVRHSGSNLVSGNRVKDFNEDSLILVNSNRLYWQLTELIRMKRESDAIKIILEKLQSLHNDQKVYIKMSVKDVKICFGDNLTKVPANTFKGIPKMSRLVKKNRIK